MTFLRKFSPIYALSHTIKAFLMIIIIEQKPNLTQTRFFKNLTNSALCSGPYGMTISVLSVQKDFKLGQFLDIEGMTSPSKFDEVS